MGCYSHDYVTLYKTVLADWSYRDPPLPGLEEANCHKVTSHVEEAMQQTTVSGLPVNGRQPLERHGNPSSETTRRRILPTSGGILQVDLPSVEPVIRPQPWISACEQRTWSRRPR